MGAFIDLTGRRFGMWTVLDRNHNLKRKQTMWNCRCDCGTLRPVDANNLSHGGSNGCGCTSLMLLGEFAATHGQTRNKVIPPTYHSWAGMKARCMNVNHKSYPQYGGKGISVCDRWLSYENFFSDMGEKPAGTSIDRIDPYGDYSPENCRWASDFKQANNKTNNHDITAFGKTQTLQEWANEIGISHGAILFRIYKAKWPIEVALSKPGRGYGGRHQKIA